MSTIAKDLQYSGNVETHFKELQKKLSGRLQQGFYSKFRGYGLRRDLERSLEKPDAKIPISVRPLEESDLDIILPADSSLPESDKLQITWRRHFYNKAPRGCAYVAIDERNGTPCYIQWLIGSAHNDELAKFKCFPRLAKDEALLEQAYTPPAYRGLRIMPAAMSRIAEEASSLGARYVVTFVEETGIASLKGCHRAGFEPHLLHRRYQLGFGVIVFNRFKKLNKNDPRTVLKF